MLNRFRLFSKFSSVLKSDNQKMYVDILDD